MTTDTEAVAVISKYHHDVSWSARLGIPVLVYDKGGGGKHSVPVNKGLEASAFLKYLCDYYDGLPKRSLFLHDEEYSWHHVGSLVDRVREALEGARQYHNLNAFRLTQIQTMVAGNNAETQSWLAERGLERDPDAWWHQLTQWFDRYLGPYLGDHTVHGDWTSGRLGCAQMLVHRERILQHPREFYEDLYRWILDTDLPCNKSARFLEWTWPLIFDRGGSEPGP